jgi:signal transduction histidine kinase
MLLSDGKQMGLGLYICKQIVKKFNGDIDFISKPGKGSSFIFSMDLEYDEEQDYSLSNQS